MYLTCYLLPKKKKYIKLKIKKITKERWADARPKITVKLNFTRKNIFVKNLNFVI